MSTNDSDENNAVQWENYTSYDFSFIHNYYINSIIVNTIFSVAGTPINVWFLVAMLLSPKIRSRLRNKIICGILVVNLTQSVIISTYNSIRFASVLLQTYHLIPCHIETVYLSIYHIQDFVGNWYILILVCVYVSQVMNFEPKFIPMWKIISTVAIFISPCVFAVLLVPLTMNSYFTPYYEGHCLETTDTALQVYACLNMIVPQALASLLLLVTAVLKYRRYPCGRFSDSFHAQLIDDRSQIDPVYPFLALLLTAVASDFCSMVTWMNPQLLERLELTIVLKVDIAALVLGYLRLFLPVMLLLFPDIRERIKTWRPCHRSAPPADLVVTYEKNTP